jgi:D-alanyl-D-alanine carboxypeptidase
MTTPVAPGHRSAGLVLGAAVWALKRFAVASAFVFVACASAAMASPASDATSPLKHDTHSVVAAGVPGALLTVTQGRHVVRVAAGLERVEPRIRRRLDRPFRIASVTKPLVAAVVLRLVEQRRLRLDDQLGRLLSDLAPPGGEHITVRQLLDHRSGLFDYTQAPDFIGAYLSGARPLEHVWTPLELARLGTSRALSFPPGTRFGYSNTDYILLGLIAQRTGHAPFAQLLRKLVLRPLRLRRTSLASGRLREPHVHGYDPIVPPFDPVGNGLGDVDRLNGSLAWTAGAMASTASDLTRFLRGLLRGRLLRQRTLRAMLPAQPGSAFAYGLGLERFRFRCGYAWGHLGSIFGYSTWALATKRAQRVAVLSLNRSVLPEAAAPRIQPLLEQALCSRLPASR